MVLVVGAQTHGERIVFPQIYCKQHNFHTHEAEVYVDGF